MLDINSIKNYYSENLHKFNRGLLREYLQYQILSIIFSHKLGKKLSFLGGTCLRIAYNLNRFSEDLDFDNKNLTFDEFKTIGIYLERELNKRGYITEIRFINKSAFHCFIKFPKLLYQEGLSPLEDEKILIQIDTFNQGVEYESEVFILDKFDLFDQILITPKSIILSQKLWTITQRKRAKGRDFYDIMFLIQSTKPDKTFLEIKFKTSTMDDIKKEISNSLIDMDFKTIAEDASPFLVNPQDKDKIANFLQFFNQMPLE